MNELMSEWCSSFIMFSWRRPFDLPVKVGQWTQLEVFSWPLLLAKIIKFFQRQPGRQDGRMYEIIK